MAEETNNIPTLKMSKHVEGFCLMTYRCALGHTELLWNSRDGVTPFNIKCNYPDCDKNSQHIAWEKDLCIPLFEGRCFVDNTIENFKEQLIKNIETNKGIQERYPTEQEREELLLRLLEGFDEGQPTIKCLI